MMSVQLSKAHHLREAFSAIAALQRDESFNEDTQDSGVLAVLEEIQKDPEAFARWVGGLSHYYITGSYTAFPCIHAV